jgi:hypothetical protein
MTLVYLAVGAEEAGQQGSGTEVVVVNDPPPRGESLRIEDDGSAAQKIVDFLADRKLL